jgi:gliding-associated putative ABC transporter substrate-binding component GldG
MISNRKYSNIIFLVIGIVVLLNLLAVNYFARLDLTEDKRYTLSDATEDLLEDLAEPVTVTAYFSNNLPPQLDHIRRDLRDMLVEYDQASDGMVVYEFIDPLKDNFGEQKAQQAGIMQMQVQVREKDQMKTQIAYMGAVISMGEDKEVLPVIQTTSGMEYSLTSSIKKLSVTDKPLVGILTGHGEAGIQQMQQAVRDLSVLYQVENVVLTDTTSELMKYNTVAVIGPSDSIPQEHLQQLTSYMEQGGNLLLAIDRVDADLNSGYPMGNAVNTGLESWLSRTGVTVNSNFVLDASAVTVMVSRQQGPFTVQQPILFPYIPRVTNFGKHPVSDGLEQLVLNFTSSIDFNGDSATTFTPFLLSSEQAATQPATTFIDAGRQWQKSDFPLKNITLGAAVEGALFGIPSKMVVIADGGFPVAEGQQQINPDNVNLLVNAIDWLSDDTGLVGLRTQGATARPIDELEDGKKAFLKYLNFLLPIVLVIGYGIFRAQNNRMLRIKRMEVGHV